MKLRRPVLIAILAGITTVNALVLVLTQSSLYPILAQYFEGDMTLEFVVLGLLVIMAVAMTAVGYGIGVEGRVRTSGKSRSLYRRPTQAANSRRTDELQTSLDGHHH
jgi:hypothetical protein